MPKTQIKVCGVTTPEDAQLCVDNEVDMIGLIFAESPRKVDAKTAYEIVRVIPPDTSSRGSGEVEGPFAASLLKVHPVGVFQDQSLEEISRILEQSGLGTAQLHGDEPHETGQALKDKGIFVIKAMTPDHVDPTYPAHLYLLDTPKGTERMDDDYRGAALSLGRRLILSGGLDAENVTTWVQEFRPVGVDVCRYSEKSPGVKDPEKIAAFVKAVRHAR